MNAAAKQQSSTTYVRSPAARSRIRRASELALMLLPSGSSQLVERTDRKKWSLSPKLPWPT
jgi:hypothetical protein